MAPNFGTGGALNGKLSGEGQSPVTSCFLLLSVFKAAYTLDPDIPLPQDIMIGNETAPPFPPPMNPQPSPTNLFPLSFPNPYYPLVWSSFIWHSSTEKTIPFSFRVLGTQNPQSPHPISSKTSYIAVTYPAQVDIVLIQSPNLLYSPLGPS